MLHVNYSSCNCYDCENKNKKFQEIKKKDGKVDGFPYKNKLENKDEVKPLYLTCDDCEKGIFNFHKYGIPTNIGVRNGDVDSTFIDDNYKFFKKSLEPTEADEYLIYNPDCWKKSEAPQFEKIDARDTRSYANLYKDDVSENHLNIDGVLGFKGVQNIYTSTEPDGRLVLVPAGGEILVLDKPPKYENMPVNDSIYTDPRMTDYRTKVYQDYTDIKSGDAIYYLPGTHSDAYYGPNYVNPMIVEGVLYKDPMGSINPEYIRKPIINYNVLDTKKNNYGELTWIRDSQETREDLMSLRDRNINSKRYNPRYTGQILFD